MTDATHVHLYAMANEVAANTYYTAHIAFNSALELTRLGRKTYHASSEKEATRIALREGLTDVFDANRPEHVVIHEDRLTTPELVLGRLPHDVRERVGNARMSFTKHLHSKCKELTKALAKQDMGSAWHTGSLGSGRPNEPLTVYIDGSHWPDTHPALADDADGSTTIAYTIVDSVGRILEMSALELEEASESLHAEYIALKYAADAVKRINPSANVTFKTDNQQLKHTFNRYDPTIPKRFRPIAGYLEGLLDTFDDAEVRHVGREKNPFTDALADVAHYNHVTFRPVDVQPTPDEPTHAYTV